MLGPRRILMTVDAVGGVWRYALDLAEGLRGRGIETVLLGFGPPPAPEQRRAAERVAQLEWSELPLDWTGGDARRLEEVPRRIAEHAERAGADLVQVNQPSQAAGLEVGMPVVAVCHSCVTSWFRVVRGGALPADWAWRGDLTARGLAAADRVVAPSRAHAALMAECYPGLGAVTVVPNATAFRTERGRKCAYAYAAARWWDEGKNAATLDAAAAEAPIPVLAAGPVTGPDGQQATFRHARAIGRLGPAAMTELATDAAIFVSPSLYEPFGLAALEAASARAALVLSDIPTYREVWGDAALFVEPHDAAGFAAAVATLASDPARRRAVAERAAERAAPLSLPAQAAGMADIYAQVLRPVPQHAI